MKQFGAWALIALASFAGLGAAYDGYLGGNPRRLVVVVDSSNAMRGAFERVDAALDELGARRYHEFALFTDRSRVHGWSERFSPGRIAPYGPRDLSRLGALGSQAEFGEADEVILLTNGETEGAEMPSGWTVRRLDR